MDVYTRRPVKTLYLCEKCHGWKPRVTYKAVGSGSFHICDECLKEILGKQNRLDRYITPLRKVYTNVRKKLGKPFDKSR